MNDKNEIKNYLLTTSAPMWNDKPLIPGREYSVYDRAFMQGFYMIWQFVHIQIVTINKHIGHYAVRLGLSNDYVELGTLCVYDSEINTKFKINLNRVLSSIGNVDLHKFSCSVKTKCSTMGVGVTGYNVGWYNSDKPAPLKLDDVRDLLLRSAPRYGSVATDSLPVEWFQNFSQSFDRDVFLSYNWLDNRGNSVKVPYFLHGTFREYTNNKNKGFVESQTNTSLPAILPNTKAKLFSWTPRLVIGGTDSDLTTTLCGSYLKSLKSLRYIKSNPVLLDIKSNNTKDLFTVDSKTLTELGNPHANKILP